MPISLALALAAAPPNLDAPLDSRPTLRSEINRGKAAAFECGLHHFGDLMEHDSCVEQVTNEAVQRVPNAAPFTVGAYFQACEDFAELVEIMEKQNDQSDYYARRIAEARHYLALTYPVLKNYQAKVKLTNAQLVAAIDELTPVGRQTFLARLAAWAKDPPHE